MIGQRPGGRALVNGHFHSGGGISLTRTLVRETRSPSAPATRLTKPRPQLRGWTRDCRTYSAVAQSHVASLDHSIALGAEISRLEEGTLLPRGPGSERAENHSGCWSRASLSLRGKQSSLGGKQAGDSGGVRITTQSFPSLGTPGPPPPGPVGHCEQELPAFVPLHLGAPLSLLSSTASLREVTTPLGFNSL